MPVTGAIRRLPPRGKPDVSPPSNWQRATVHRTVAFRLFDSRLLHQKRRTLRVVFFGAGNRNRTGTDFTPRDFKSLVSTYSTMPAHRKCASLFCCRVIRLPASCCGARRMSSALKSLRPSSTAATRSPRCICHRQRSARSPESHRCGFYDQGFKSLVSTYSTMPAAC